MMTTAVGRASNSCGDPNRPTATTCQFGVDVTAHGRRSGTYWSVRRSGWLMGVGVMFAASAIVSAAGGGAATVTQPAVRLRSHDRALLVSDSAWLGIKTYGAVDSVRGFEHMLDLASCRRRVATSCRNYDGYVPIPLYDEVEWRRGVFNTLIVATGYNDSDHDFRDDVDAIVGLARVNGYERIVWLTLRSNVTYQSPDDAGFAAVFGRNNAVLTELAASGTHPELVVADWAAYAKDRPEWFASDGIHLRRAGPFAAGDYISRKMAFLDGRSCPVAERVGDPAPDPCPDPDVTGPVADIDGLYPVGEPFPPSPFVLEWEGFGSWPGPPWWEQ